VAASTCRRLAGKAQIVEADETYFGQHKTRSPLSSAVGARTSSVAAVRLASTRRSPTRNERLRRSGAA
jgi:hypothetical protein